jgi:aryl-alcohol dehydrogenase-like predicted oxidoreductase
MLAAPYVFGGRQGRFRRAASPAARSGADSFPFLNSILQGDDMRYNTLGGTGLLVSEICLGTMTFGGQGFWTAIGSLDQSVADRIVAGALDKGVNFIDTADVYSEGLSEEITGAAIRNSGRSRSDVVLATKVFGSVGKGVNDRGASRGHIMDGVKASLKRLGTDYIDLYQIHGTDPVTPIEETVRALDDLVREGLIRYVGVSNWPAWRIMKALGIADRLGLDRIASLQAYYTIAGRDLEREIAPLLLSEKVGLMVWSPLAGGLLSGKYGRDGSGEGRRANFDFPPVNRDRAFDAVDVMAEIARDKGVSVARIALAYVLHKPFVSSVIIGAKSVEQLDDNIAASEVVLSADELSRLDAVSALPAEYPGWMLERQGAERASTVAKPR